MANVFTAAEKAKAARNEVAMRRQCYPKWANVATVDQLPAGQRRKIDLMEAIAADYEALAQAEAAALELVQGSLFAEAQPGPFPPACPVCGQQRNQCVCPDARA
ncbi:hypothetical protein KB206_10795 [Microvirga sp. STS02]|uniref:hypothetical protein n=1 Tax=Hymenobacter negativus TaxID=2795026 RepID=UPI0018DD3264|nr:MULTISPECIES: hypothetical protein [Bacteria]MBH8569374.1 hypothetical protein [Hymenobacter negativus]MBR7209108.1 hypothetical protein [Microvirga sp. STS02]